MTARRSPAKAARDTLAKKYDADAKRLQGMHDFATEQRPDTNRSGLQNAADRARTYAQRARRTVGPKGERVPAKPPAVPAKPKRRR